MEQKVIDSTKAGGPLMYPDIGQRKPNVIGNVAMIEEESLPSLDAEQPQSEANLVDHPNVTQRKKSPRRKTPPPKSPIRKSPRKKSATPRRSSPRRKTSP